MTYKDLDLLMDLRVSQSLLMTSAFKLGHRFWKFYANLKSCKNYNCKNSHCRIKI